MKRFQCTCIFLLLLPALLHAYPFTIPSLLRKASGPDLTDEWTLAPNGKNTSVCPKNMTYTTYNRSTKDGNLYLVGHNTILHDGKRCDGTTQTMTYYNSSYLGTDKVPAEMTRVIASTGFLNRTTSTLLNSKDGFLVGYADPALFCEKTNTKFVQGTVILLVRPFKPLPLPEIEGGLKVGTKYQIVYPKYNGSPCVYEKELPDAQPSPEAGDGDDEDNEDGNNERECFSGDSVVQLENGGMKKMENVVVGDRVLTGVKKYSEVFLFTHKIKNGNFDFLQIKTHAGNIIKVTRGHYLYLNGKLAAASTAKTGDIVKLATGAESTIASVNSVQSKGLYNPQTLDGDIVVNGVVASTYTTAVEPSFAHALLCPLRTAYSVFGVTTSFFESGGKGFETFAPRGSRVY